MNEEHIPVQTGSRADAIDHPALLTVSQAYEYLIVVGLPRSKKTIRKWCRMGHVEKKQNVIPGGPKWLILRTSLDARVAEERFIDGSLSRETGTNPPEPVPEPTHSDRSAAVRDDELVEILKQQLAHEREARTASEEKNRELLTMYHDIAMASAQVGMEIGKGMQAQLEAKRGLQVVDPAVSSGQERSTGDNSQPEMRQLKVQSIHGELR
jgi:hypothetical protein